MTDLDLISTDALIDELAGRHRELIVIRDHQKTINQNDVFVKTPFGKFGKKDKGFDLIVATEMLGAAHSQLIMDYLKD